MKNICHYADCLQFMESIPNKYFPLAIVDPQYGLDRAGTHSSKSRRSRTHTKTGYVFRVKEYARKTWDHETPPASYFRELFRISENQIIFGANYFIDSLPNLDHFIYWHKKGQSNDIKYNEGELAFSSFPRSRMFDFWWNGLGSTPQKCGESRIHPNQKPVQLYKWILTEFAVSGWTVFDSHVGSGSIRIACYDLGFDFVGCERDQDHWDDQERRFKNHIAQAELFTPEERQKMIFKERDMFEGEE